MVRWSCRKAPSPPSRSDCARYTERRPPSPETRNGPPLTGENPLQLRRCANKVWWKDRGVGTRVDELPRGARARGVGVQAAPGRPRRDRTRAMTSYQRKDAPDAGVPA